MNHHSEQTTEQLLRMIAEASRDTFKDLAAKQEAQGRHELAVWARKQARSISAVLAHIDQQQAQESVG